MKVVSLLYCCSSMACAKQPGKFAGIGQRQPVHGPGAGNVKQAAVIFAGVGLMTLELSVTEHRLNIMIENNE